MPFFECPLPILETERVLLAHGGGGRLMHELITRMILPTLGHVGAPHDGAVLPIESGTLAFTTDSYVVAPLFFAGGDIGNLAVNGTINDLAMCGAEPLALSCAIIVEEGFSLVILERVLRSLGAAADKAGVSIITGDTKVVERGKVDGLFINTAGIGRVIAPVPVRPERIVSGDMLLVSGDLGRHGIAVLAARGELGFDCQIESDSTSLWAPVLELFEAGVDVHCLRDLTRGGLLSAIIELAEASYCTFRLDERAITVPGAVQAACEFLGLDPLQLANEGRFVACVPQCDADRALDILRRHDASGGAAILGKVLVGGRHAEVVMTSRIGTVRLLTMPSGEQLPRIC